MRVAVFILSVVTLLAIPVVLFPTHGVVWVSPQEIVASLAIWPLLILSACLCIYAGRQIYRDGVTELTIFMFVIAALFPGIFIGRIVGYEVGKRSYGNHKNRWFAIADYVNPRLLQCYEQHPERFHRHTGNEQVDVDGFTDFLTSQPDFRASGIRVRRGGLLDPWGRPITFLQDWNHDNSLYGVGESIWNGAGQPTEESFGVMLSERSRRAIRGYDYICGRNGFKLKVR